MITELTLRLHPIPEHIVVARAAFPSVESACRAAAAIIGSGVPVTRCELLDAMTIAALECVRRHELPGVAVSLRRVRRHRGGRRRRPRDDARARRGRGRDCVRVRERSDRAQPDVERAAQRADGVARARAGLEGDDDGCRGAGVRACGGDRACARRARRIRVARRDRRPRRRRQLPRRVPARSRRCSVDRAGRGAEREPRRRCARARRHVHRRARHRLRQARVSRARARRPRPALSRHQAALRPERDHESRARSCRSPKPPGARRARRRAIAYPRAISRRFSSSLHGFGLPEPRLERDLARTRSARRSAGSAGRRGTGTSRRRSARRSARASRSPRRPPSRRTIAPTSSRSFASATSASSFSRAFRSSSAVFCWIATRISRTIMSAQCAGSPRATRSSASRSSAVKRFDRRDLREPLEAAAEARKAFGRRSSDSSGRSGS